MPIDINLLRKYKGNDPDEVRESQKRRFASVELVDEVIALDEEWREVQLRVEQSSRFLKECSKKIKMLMKEKKKEEVEVVKEEIKIQKMKDVEDKKRSIEVKSLRDIKLGMIGNIVPADQGIPISNNEDADNKVVWKWGEFKTNDNGQLKKHHELLWMIGGFEPQRGTAVAGHRGYFLTGPGVLLNEALKMYGVHYLTNKGYTSVIPPYFMNKEVMSKIAQLAEFDEALYHVKGENNDSDKYLIATSEQPLSAYHMNEWLREAELPLRYAGVSTCFRKEAGAHGKDNNGIFRVHQFDKIEQFAYVAPDKSWEEHERMIQVSMEYFKSLGIPFHVVAIVSGELNNAAAKKYDLEGWYPGYQKFRELVSCSNCTDYQSRAAEVRCGVKVAGAEKKYVHMLNSTLVACTRAICGVLENHQTEEGIHVPEVLLPYMNGVTFIPFVRSLKGYIAEEEGDAPAAAPKAKTNKRNVKAAESNKESVSTPAPKPNAAATIDAHAVELPVEVVAAGEKIRSLKAAKASKDEIVAAVKELNDIKAKYGIVVEDKAAKRKAEKAASKARKQTTTEGVSNDNTNNIPSKKENMSKKNVSKAVPVPATASSANKDNKSKDGTTPSTSTTTAATITTTATTTSALLVRLASNEGKSKLEKLLINGSYISGFTPNSEDSFAFDILSNDTVDEVKYPNITRWLTHIGSYSVVERGAWPVTVAALMSVNYDVRSSTIFN